MQENLENEKCINILEQATKGVWGFEVPLFVGIVLSA